MWQSQLWGTSHLTARWGAHPSLAEEQAGVRGRRRKKVQGACGKSVGVSKHGRAAPPQSSLRHSLTDISQTPMLSMLPVLSMARSGTKVALSLQVGPLPLFEQVSLEDKARMEGDAIKQIQAMLGEDTHAGGSVGG